MVSARGQTFLYYQVMANNTKKKKSNFRRVCEWLHLWLGLVSGIVVFIVCFMAALWVFRDEMDYFANPEERIQKEELAFVQPSKIREYAKDYLAHSSYGTPLEISSISYRSKTETGYIGFKTQDSTYLTAYFNPYSGKILFVKDDEKSKLSKFLLFVRAGHRWIWLPRKIGTPVVGTSCILFLFTIITGIIWWYPKKWNQSTRDKSFKIKWTAKWKRLNIDLHNVLGFYAFAFSFILITTGIAYSFKWFNNFSRWTLTGKTKEEKFESAYTIPANKLTLNSDTLDIFFNEAAKLTKRKNDAVFLRLPTKENEGYAVNFLSKSGKNHSQIYYTWDAANHSVVSKNKRFEEKKWGERMFSYNFELHVGTIFGLPSKILACLTSLIGASLPVTGFIIWWNRKKKSKKPLRHSTR